MVVQGSDLVGPTEAKNPTPLARQRKMSNLWDQAFENLRHGHRKLPESYARVLRGIETPESACRDQQMLAIINQRLEQMKSRQWKIKLAGTNFRIREQIDRIVRVVSVIRDLGNSGAALDPVHAGLAWAGVCVLLSVIVNQSEAREAATAGIEKIAILIPRYKQVEAIYLENESDHSAKIQLRNAIVNLYSKILEYQIELARYLEKGAFKRISSFARDALKLDDWKDKMQKIHDSDDNCRASMAVYGAALTNITQETLRKMLTQLDEKVNRGIADIITSHSVVEWNPGPNTDPGYVSVLYGGVQGRAGSFRISLADIKNDEQLFVQMRAAIPLFAPQKHPMEGHTIRQFQNSSLLMYDYLLGITHWRRTPKTA
ncbi:hypothetical protein N7467_008970 [Penicillium canescens]|nr:hypothetical protein N7467_008970 [Penicillium canescens]